MNRRRHTSILTLLAFVSLGMLGSCATTEPAKALADEYYNLGNSWFDLKKFDLAARAYQKALTLNPALKVASVNLARTRAENGDPKGALELMEPLASSDPDNLVVAQYRAWLTAKKDGPAAAADLYQALAQKLPGDGPTQFNAGLCLQAAGRLDEAKAAWMAWKALDGKSTTGLTGLAETLDGLKSDDTAAAWLDVVASLPDQDPQRFAPLVARGRALEAAEAYGDAVQAWDEALALAPAPDQKRAELKFRQGRLLLLKIQDWEKGSQAVVAAWKEGYTDADAWKGLRTAPELTFGPQLEAALAQAGVKP